MNSTAGNIPFQNKNIIIPKKYMYEYYEKLKSLQEHIQPVNKN